MSKGDAHFARCNVDWPTDPRCRALNTTQRWLNHCLWLLCCKNRTSMLHQCYIDVTFLSHWCGIDARSVQRGIKRMVELNLVEYQQDGSLKVFGVETNNEPIMGKTVVENLGKKAHAKPLKSRVDTEQNRIEGMHKAHANTIIELYKNTIRGEQASRGRSNIIAWLKEGRTVQEMDKAITHYEQLIKKNETQTKYRKLCSNFFGRAEDNQAWLDYIEPPQERGTYDRDNDRINREQERRRKENLELEKQLAEEQKAREDWVRNKKRNPTLPAKGA